MLQKYTLLEDDSIIYDGVELFRIKALVDFSDVKVGQLGGYIQSYSNLSQEGNCWVYQRSKVMKNAFVCDDAKIKSPIVTDNAVINGFTTTFLRMFIGGDVKITSNKVVLTIKIEYKIRSIAIELSITSFLIHNTKGNYYLC